MIAGVIDLLSRHKAEIVSLLRSAEDVGRPRTRLGREPIKTRCPFLGAKQTFCARIEYFRL
jgi:hypothetical protein